MTPRQLLAAARRLVDESGPSTAGWWPRASALLGRQALEQGLREHWRRTSPGAGSATFRAQLVCFAQQVDHPAARRAPWIWSALSEACHFQGYELDATAQELRQWLEGVDQVLAACEGDHSP